MKDIFDITDTVLESRIAQFFILSHKDLDSLLNDAVGSEIFSGDSEKQFDHLQDMMFLHLYLVIMYKEQKECLVINGTVVPGDTGIGFMHIEQGIPTFVVGGSPAIQVPAEAIPA